jgi:hypothetical protein
LHACCAWLSSAYCWPTLVAASRDHGELEALAGLNLLLGWTVLGWLVLLAWARWGPATRRDTH